MGANFHSCSISVLEGYLRVPEACAAVHSCCATELQPLGEDAYSLTGRHTHLATAATGLGSYNGAKSIKLMQQRFPDIDTVSDHLDSLLRVKS